MINFLKGREGVKEEMCRDREEGECRAAGKAEVRIHMEECLRCVKVWKRVNVG
jgi:hypothetical protein